MSPRKPKKNRKKKKGTVAGAGAPPASCPHGTPPPAGEEYVEDKEEKEKREGRWGGVEEDDRMLNWLVDAFSSSSLEVVRSGYRKARGDAARAVDILGASSEESITSESSRDVPVVGNTLRGRKQKKVVASTGLVSNVIGKRGGGAVVEGTKNGYVIPGEAWKDRYALDQAEEFLCSMLGGTCELDPSLVKGVFGQCGYDVEKTLDTLLDMSAPSNKSRESSHEAYEKLNYASTCREGFSNSCFRGNIGFQIMHNTSGSRYYSNVQAFQISESVAYDSRDCNGAQFCLDDHSSSMPRTGKLSLQQKVLESLFSLPDTSEHIPSRMNWKKALQKVESFCQGIDFGSPGTTDSLQKLTNSKYDDYMAFRSVATQHWETMKSYYQRAAEAYLKGQHAHASHLSDEGKFYSKLAREADEKASQEIFYARNKDIRNSVTIDLHGQHIKQAIRLLKLHLLLFSYIRSMQFLRVITGCGTHGVGKGKLKQAVIDLVQKEGIEWTEDNPGTLILKISGLREYSFTMSDSDTE